MMSRELMVVLTAVIMGVVAVSVASGTEANIPAEPNTVPSPVIAKGTVSVIKDANDVITGVKLTTEDKMVYNILLDKTGIELGSSMNGKMIEATGIKEGINIKVLSYKLVEKNEGKSEEKLQPEDIVEGAKEEIKHVMRKHVDGIKAKAINEPGYSVTEKRWEKLFSDGIITFTTDTAIRLVDEAIRDGKHHVQSKTFDTIYVAVSVVPTIDNEKAKALFTGGYFQVLDGLLNQSGWLQSDRDFAHWIYCYEGKDKHEVHLTFIPAKSLTSGQNVWIFAQDLMTSEEKTRAGIK